MATRYRMARPCPLGYLGKFRDRPELQRGTPSFKVLGFTLLGVAAAIFVGTAEHWKKVFPGIMLAATLGALLELEHGHVLNNVSAPIPRWIALVQLAVVSGVAVLSFAFAKRPLKILDRLALLIFCVSIFIGGDEATRQKLPVALIVGGACVLAAWAYDYARRRRRGTSDSGSHRNHVMA